MFWEPIKCSRTDGPVNQYISTLRSRFRNVVKEWIPLGCSGKFDNVVHKKANKKLDVYLHYLYSFRSKVVCRNFLEFAVPRNEDTVQVWGILVSEQSRSALKSDTKAVRVQLERKKELFQLIQLYVLVKQGQMLHES